MLFSWPPVFNKLIITENETGLQHLIHNLLHSLYLHPAQKTHKEEAKQGTHRNENLITSFSHGVQQSLLDKASYQASNGDKRKPHKIHLSTKYLVHKIY